MSDKLVQKIFMDRHGNVTLTQKPNLPLIVWLLATIMEKILSAGPIDRLASLVAFGAIFTWAWLETFQGVNYFRRALGLLVMIMITAARI